MKTIKKEHITYTNEYEALDGTIFNTEEECIKYENSAVMVLNSKYKKLVIKESNEWGLFKFGSEEELIDVIKLNSEADIDLVLQLHCFYNPHIKDGFVDICRKLLVTAYVEHTLVFISRGNKYDGPYFWVRTSESEIKDSLDKLYELMK